MRDRAKARRSAQRGDPFPPPRIAGPYRPTWKLRLRLSRWRAVPFSHRCRRAEGHAGADPGAATWGRLDRSQDGAPGKFLGRANSRAGQIHAQGKFLGRANTWARNSGAMRQASASLRLTGDRAGERAGDREWARVQGPALTSLADAALHCPDVRMRSHRRRLCD